MARHPDAAARGRAEAASVLGPRAPAFADVPRLVWAQQVVQEAMRLDPPAWVLARSPTRKAPDR